MRNILFLTLLLGLIASGCDSNSQKTADTQLNPTQTQTVGDGQMGPSFKETVNTDGTYAVTVNYSGAEVATINVYDFKDQNEYLYVGVNPTGMGGYILYGGAAELYQINLDTKAVIKVFSSNTNDSFVTDVSPDDKTLAIFTGNEAGEHILSLSSITDSSDGGKFVDIDTVVPKEFDEAGDATFSPDGTQLAYQATIKFDDAHPEETALFVIDLNTGKQTEFARKNGLFDIEWQENGSPVSKL